VIHHSFIRIIGVTLILLVFLLADVALFAAPTLPVFWHPTSDALSSDIQTLAAAPDALYAGTWGQGITLSTDHGATWITATAGLTLPMYIRGGLAVNPVTPAVLFARDTYGTLSGAGVYSSTDDGISWTVSLRDVGVETLLSHPLTLM